MSAADIKNILEARKLARRKLKSIPRSDGTTAYDHAIRVETYLAEKLCIQDGKMLTAAILHDILEDSDVSLSYLEEHFGSKVAQTVQQLTRYGNNKFQDSLKKMGARISQNLLISNLTPEVRMIKCTDRIDNLASMLKIRSNDFRFARVPYWLVETRISMLPIAKKTDVRVYRDMLRLVRLLESKFKEEVDRVSESYFETLNQNAPSQLEQVC